MHETLVTFTTETPGNHYVAICTTCGWHGRDRALQTRALTDAVHHHEQNQ